MKQHTWLIMILLATLLTITGCSGPGLLVRPATPTTVPVPTATLTPMPLAQPVTLSSQSVGEALAAVQGRLERIYTEVSPSVVNIRMVQKEERTFPIFPDIPGFRFFQPPSGQEPQEYYRQGLASGFVWDKKGHIVTNNHVVAGADKISVIFSDGTTVPAIVVGADPDSDLAVVKVDMPADQLRPVTLVDSSQVKVGQLAIALGNPFGLQGTMTVGIVSALGRLLPASSENSQGPSYTIPDIIQTDAPINPGNSGGVLVDDQGRVIGVTAAIESPVRASAGIGFAIPSAVVKKTVPVLIETGHYEHPWVGISGISLVPEISKAMGLKPDRHGALVVDVTPGSPADKAGLHGSGHQVTIEGAKVRVGGDVIVAIDEQPVKGFDDLVTYLARSTEVGQTITLTILRQDKEKTINVELAARPKQQTQQSKQERSTTGTGAWLGIVGLSVTPEIAKSADLPSDQQGVLIEQIEQGSPADQAGLRGSYKPVVVDGRSLLIGGDVIIAMDEQPVNQMEDLKAMLQQAQPDQKVMLTILRDGKQNQVQVILGKQATNLP